MHFYKYSTICLLTPLLMACSDEPSETEVQGLIQAQYDQATGLMNDAMASAGAENSEAAKAVGDMMSGMMPKLESVEDVNCDSIEGDNTYMCTANIHQTLAGKSREDKASFKVYRVNDEWVLEN